MKKNNPLMTTHEADRLKNLKPEKTDLRIGKFYSHLYDWQKKKFDRIVSTVARKYDLELNRNPVEMILIRQIAMCFVRIDEGELFLRHNADHKWVTDLDNKWLPTMRKELREALRDLSTMVKVQEKQGKVLTFDTLRNKLRDDEDLPADRTIMAQDGHKRRYYDKVTRTKNKKVD